jgi:hypothetical protein
MFAEAKTQALPEQTKGSTILKGRPERPFCLRATNVCVWPDPDVLPCSLHVGSSGVKRTRYAHFELFWR